MPRYFAFIKKSIKGPFPPKDIYVVPGFCRTTLVCPEAALGQWREAHLEGVFQALLDPSAPQPSGYKPALTHETADRRALKSLLEKASLQTVQLETEQKELRREYSGEKRRLEEELGKKDAAIRSLSDRITRMAAAQTEHPSWEHLYKNLKKHADEKLTSAAQALAEKNDETLRLKTQIQNMVDTYENSKRVLQERDSRKRDAVDERLKELNSELEEKETLLRSMTDNMSSLMAKNEEFQRIMLDERKDYEAQNAGFCEEIGKLKSEMKWKQQETERLAADLAEARSRIHEFESADKLRTREQEELYGVIHAKVKILSGYFENLESRLKYAFKKA